MAEAHEPTVAEREIEPERRDGEDDAAREEREHIALGAEEPEKRRERERREQKRRHDEARATERRELRVGIGAAKSCILNPAPETGRRA